MTRDDVKKALAILSKWRLSAVGKKNEAARKDVELVIRVVEWLSGGKA